MTTPPDPDNLDWNRDQHGSMADYATGPEGEPQTEPYQPEKDDGDALPDPPS
jgi:hypothetical protein